MTLALNFSNVILLQGDEDGWIQILVLAVIIGLSAIKSLTSQRKQKRDLDQQQRPVRRPAPPPTRQVPSRAAEKQPAVKPARPAPQPARETPRETKPRTIGRPRGALSAFVAEIKEEIKRAAEEMQAAEVQIAAEAARPQPQKPPQPAPPILEPEEPLELVAKPAAKPEPETWSAIMPEFADTDDLKRAIIYLEVLGKPVSLRNPSEQLIGL